MKRWIIIVLAALLIAVTAFFLGVLSGDEQLQSHSTYALRKTGLSEEYSPYYELHGYTGSRDSFSQTEFIVQYETDRNKLLSEIRKTANWHLQPVSSEQYRRFQSKHMWDCAKVLSVPDEIVFDAWYYLETAGPVSYPEDIEFESIKSGFPGRGFEFAVFDVQSGLFIFVDQFG